MAKACVDAVVDGPNISNNDGQGLQEFADRSRTLYETLRSLNALSEMNMSNLAKMSGKLPVVLQIKWRDEALRIRERKGFPTLEDLVMFIERRAEAAIDPVFGKVGETKQFFQRRNPRASRQPLPPSLNVVTGPKTTTMAVQVGPSDPAKSHKESNSTTLKVKCYGCECTHKIEHCPDFLNKSIRQRIVFARYKGLCLNCLRKGHFVSECQSTFNCKHCQQPHHSLLHKPIEDKEGTLANPKEGPGPREQANVNTVTTAPVETACRTYSTTSRTKVALQVVPAKIMSKEGDSVATYALLDTVSEETFLSKAICDKLGLQVSNCANLAVCTLSGESPIKVGQANVRVKAVHSQDNRTLEIENVKVVDNLNITTARAKDLSKWPHLKDFEIPDVDDGQVAMLIGTNVPEAKVHEEFRRGGSGGPYAVRTVLGWAVLGPVDAANIMCSQPKNVNFVKYGDELVYHEMKQFLRLEDIDMNRSSKKGMSIKDQEALKRMKTQFV